MHVCTTHRGCVKCEGVKIKVCTSPENKLVTKGKERKRKEK